MPIPITHQGQVANANYSDPKKEVQNAVTTLLNHIDIRIKCAIVTKTSITCSNNAEVFYQENKTQSL